MRPAPAPLPCWLHDQRDAVFLDVIVAPRSSRTRIVDVFDNRLKIQLTAPPVDGQANQALVDFLAKTLGVARAQVSVVGGLSNRRKTVRVAAVTPQLAMLKLTPVRDG